MTTAARISLADWLLQQPASLHWRQAADVVMALTNLLAKAHAQGVCHGAICPEVIRVAADAGPDWHGLTLAFPHEVHQQDDGETIDRRCQAPEQQFRSAPADGDGPRIDVYGVGVLLYRLLCNRYPFRAVEPDELIREILQDAPQPPRQLAHHVPRELEQLCLRLLAKDPSARPANGQELALELQQVVAAVEMADPGYRSQDTPLAARRKMEAPPGVDPLLVLSWQATPITARLQQAFRDHVEQHQGMVLRQSETMTVARLTPMAGVPSGLPTLLDQALRFLSSVRLDDAALDLAIDSAESDTLRRRAPRLRGRVTPNGLEVTPPSWEALCRWLPHHRGGALLRALRPGRGASCQASPLVGRSAQLAMLKTRWDQAREGMGQVVLLIGDEGAGKTRLLRELRDYVAAAQSCPWIRWAGRPCPLSESLHPAIDFFRDPATPTAIGLSEPELAELTASPRRERGQQLLLGWLKRVAAAAPVVFIVEDLQWVDPATLMFLQTLVDRGVNEHVLTILTFRPEFETPWGSRAHQTQVALSRLSKRHAASLFSSITGIREPSSMLVEELMSASDGIPLFVEGFSWGWSQRDGECHGIAKR